MSTRHLIISGVTFSFLCGFVPLGMTDTQSCARSTQNNAVTPGSSESRRSQRKG
jgi:hypothetical protein